MVRRRGFVDLLQTLHVALRVVVGADSFPRGYSHLAQAIFVSGKLTKDIHEGLGVSWGKKASNAVVDQLREASDRGGRNGLT